MGRGPLGDLGFVDRVLDGFLNVSFVEMVAPEFFGFRNKRKRLGRKKPLPNKFFGAVFVLFLE